MMSIAKLVSRREEMTCLKRLTIAIAMLPAKVKFVIAGRPSRPKTVYMMKMISLAPWPIGTGPS